MASFQGGVSKFVSGQAAVLIGKNQHLDLFDVVSVASPYPKLPQDVGPCLIALCTNADPIKATPS